MAVCIQVRRFDVLACPRCRGRLHLIALIDQAPAIQQILRHLGLPSEIPAPAAARTVIIVSSPHLLAL